MKRLMTLLLAAGLVLGATSAAKAVDFKMTGLWQNRVSFADRNFEKHNGDDKMRAATRLRTQIDVIASESLKGVMFFEIGHQNWGKAARRRRPRHRRQGNQGPLQLRGLDHSPDRRQGPHGPPEVYV